MAMVPWRRRNQSELATLRGGMDDWFENFLRGLDRPLAFFGQRAWPAIDVAEKEDAVLVRAEVPGLKPEDIDISVYGNTLTISGEKKETKEDQGDGFYHVESSYGSFRREVALSTDVDESKIEAVCKDGILSITLPKAEKSKAVKVKIQG
jgi:HSP20 family protein